MRALLIIAALLSTLACHTSKKAGSTSASNMEEGKPDTQKEQSPQLAKNIRLIVTFASIGAGIDPNGKTMLDDFINSFKEKSGKLVKYGTLDWGREGEFDCEFSLNELNLNEQTDFVKGLKKQFEGNQLIQVEENKPSRFN